MDADQNDSSSQASGASDDQSKRSESTVDYKAKYGGMQKKFDKTNADLIAKQTELDLIHAQHEQELSQLRNEVNTNKTRAQELETLHKAEKDRADKEFSRAEKLAKRSEKRIEIADKYPSLLELFDTDDLKEREQFADDDLYIKYLDRQASRFGQSSTPPNTQSQSQTFNQQQGTQFRVPPTGGTVRVNANSGGRNADVIKSDIQKANPNTQAYWDLLNELDALNK